jgi:hypothetical protein
MSRRRDQMHMPSDPQGPIKISDLSELVAGLPALFGFKPRESLMFLALDTPRGRLGFRARVDLPAPTELPAAAEQLVLAAVANRVSSVIVVCHSNERSTGVHAAECLAAAFDQRCVDVADVVVLDDFRFHSLTCGSAQCCPPEGRGYDSTTSLLVAEAVARGERVLADRRELATEVAGPDPATARQMSRACDRVRERLVARHGIDPSQPEARLGIAALRAGASAVKAVMATGMATGAADLSDDDVAALGVWCRSIMIRDLAWAQVDAGDPHRHLLFWQGVARRTIAPFEPAVLSLAAFCAWVSGDGARAWCALDRALEADRDYSLARLLSSVLTKAVPPSTWVPMTEDAVWSAVREPG